MELQDVETPITGPPTQTRFNLHIAEWLTNIYKRTQNKQHITALTEARYIYQKQAVAKTGSITNKQFTQKA